jgi:hypothetical protein
VLADAVLDDVLSELIEQTTFKCRNWKLGAKMVASKTNLNWQDYDRIDQVRRIRNDVAHEAKLASKIDCLLYVNTIKAELLAWKILQSVDV